jgi:fumarate hydratase subunit alpha
VFNAIKKAHKKEKHPRAKKVLAAIVENATHAKKHKLAICQDTGIPVVFVEVGQDVSIKGDLKAAINKGIHRGYNSGNLRHSIVKDPLSRGRPGHTPTVIHTDIVKGDKVRITVLPKGFGCENKTQLRMFNPTVGLDEIKQFIIDAVKHAGADACPPYFLGVGIGGTADYGSLMAKKALLHQGNYLKPFLVRKLESELLREINKLNIGPMGLGGRTTALSVNVLTYPTHIAGFPVAVNISCHALRSATAVI